MSKQHLKRLASPNTWDIKKKNITFVARPKPGAHKMNYSMPISLMIKEFIGLAKTTKEVKYILHNKDCLLDGKLIYDDKKPAGLMDVVSFPKQNENYRVSLNKRNKLFTVKISDAEAKIKLSKIVGKTLLKGGKFQLNCSDGRNIIVENSKDYSIGDSIKISLPEQKIEKIIHLEKGSLVLLVAGKHAGMIGKVNEFKENMIVVANEEMKATTKKDYAFVLGKDKPEITL